MAYAEATLASSYKLRLTVDAAEKVASNEVEFTVKGEIRKGTGSGKWANGSYSWQLRSPVGTVIDSGTGTNYDFRNYSILTLRSSKKFTFSGSGARTFRLTFTDIATYGELGSASVDITITPKAIPLIPTGLTVTRVSDSQMSLVWANPGPAYTSVPVERRTDGGVWVGVGSASGNATAFTDSTTAADRKYEYRVAGVAAAGQSAFTAASAPVFTTPAPVSSVSAVRDGLDIVVSASGFPPHATAFDVYDNAVLVEADVAFPYVDVSPNPAVPHTYTVVSRVAGLSSVPSSPSNTVQLEAAPNAPTGLAPNGKTADVDADLTLSWQHNPVDSSTQTQVQHRVRPVAGAWDTKTALTQSAQSLLVTPATFFGAVGVYEWETRTRGSHVDWSPWSATATVELIAKPTAALSSPVTPWNASKVVATWAFFQAQGKPQSAWEAQLRDDAGVVLEQRSGSGAGSTITFNRRVTDGDGFDVRVRVKAGDVWSEWAVAAFTVAFLLPHLPVVSGEWVESGGFVSLDIDPGEPDPGEAVTAALTVERSVDGDVWEPMTTLENEHTAIVDHLSLSKGDTFYRVSAVTVEGAEAVTVITVPCTSDSIWLSGGEGFTIAARLPFYDGITVTDGRATSLREYFGETMPNVFGGSMTSRVLAVKGATHDVDEHVITASMADLELLAMHPSRVFMHRDPDGRRVFGAISEIPQPRLNGAGYWGYQYTLRETKH